MMRPQMAISGSLPGDRPARLVVENLGVHYGDRSALEVVSARFGPAETVGLLGPNGAGKSTLLKVLAGMLAPSHGVVRAAGEPKPAVVYVPQRSDADWTFPIGVLDVVLLARARRRTRLAPFGSADRQAALAVLDQVGMRRFATVQIGQLSGGQQQRVFLARALLQDGDVYLLDEPFSGVDIPTQEMLVGLFGRLRAAGKTIVYATHDLAQAARSSDRVLLLNRRVIAAGPPTEVMTEANLRAAFGGQVVVVVGGSAA